MIMRCLGENEEECPVCGPDYARLEREFESMALKTRDHESFKFELETSSDGFGLVANYFGLNAFEGIRFH